jgi:hypothetical protein
MGPAIKGNQDREKQDKYYSSICGEKSAKKTSKIEHLCAAANIDPEL